TADCAPSTVMEVFVPPSETTSSRPKGESKSSQPAQPRSLGEASSLINPDAFVDESAQLDDAALEEVPPVASPALPVEADATGQTSEDGATTLLTLVLIGGFLALLALLLILVRVVRRRSVG